MNNYMADFGINYDSDDEAEKYELFTHESFDLEPARQQKESQKPVGRQSILQFEVTHDESSPKKLHNLLL